MGFCLFSNVSVAVKWAQRRRLCKRVLIVDWDVHHGNGTEKAFLDDADVLYFSVHRHDDGRFYPFSGSVSSHGFGSNVNVPLNRVEGARFGDAAYLDIWKCVLLPLAAQFSPDLVVVSAGFDACVGDPINGGAMAVSPVCYGVLCRMLKAVCTKVAVVLEGGYRLDVMSAAVACVAWALLSAHRPSRDLVHFGASAVWKYVERGLLHKVAEFEREMECFVDANFESFIDCAYHEEQHRDDTKVERRRVMKQVLAQHCKYWSKLVPISKFFNAHY